MRQRAVRQGVLCENPVSASLTLTADHENKVYTSGGLQHSTAPNPTGLAGLRIEGKVVAVYREV